MNKPTARIEEQGLSQLAIPMMTNKFMTGMILNKKTKLKRKRNRKRKSSMSDLVKGKLQLDQSAKTKKTM
jgi:hypothetical protein